MRHLIALLLLGALLAAAGCSGSATKQFDTGIWAGSTAKSHHRTAGPPDPGPPPPPAR